jgi:glycosyltransferase involved in cell wall biosynthesis
VVSLVGRINRWKGQADFVQAAAEILCSGLADVRFLIVGDPAPGQEELRSELHRLIRSTGFEHRILLHPFVDDVNVVWAATDIAVVPSLDPEPFGRVAIEAMSHSIPVVASAHGGLVEIVVDEVTGLLVPPRRPDLLAVAIRRLIVDATLRGSMGRASMRRQLTHFSQAAHDQALLRFISQNSSGGDWGDF